MSRTIPTNIANALSDSFIIPVIFVQLEFDSGILYLHTDLGTIVTTDTSPNKTWSGVGNLGQVGKIEERNDLSPTAVRLILSGLDATILDECLNQNYFERPASLYLGLRDTVTGLLVDDIFEIYSGFMDNMEIVSGPEKVSINLTIESEMVEFYRSQLLYYSNSQQQDEFSGDLFFEFLPEMINKTFKWAGGRDPIRPPTPRGPGGAPPGGGGRTGAPFVPRGGGRRG